MAETEKTQKFVFRSALRPDQISFSHSQDPKATSNGPPKNSPGRRRRTCWAQAKRCYDLSSVSAGATVTSPKEHISAERRKTTKYNGDRTEEEITMQKGIGLTVAVALTAIVGTGSANAGDKMKIGVPRHSKGTYTVLGEDGMRGYRARGEGSNKRQGRWQGNREQFVGASGRQGRIRRFAPSRSWLSRTRSMSSCPPLSGSEGIAVTKIGRKPSRRSP